MKDFSHLNTGKFSGSRILGLVILSSMVLGGVTAFFLFYFSVSKIIIHKDENDLNLQHGKILQMLEFVKGENLFILSGEFLEKQIKIRFPELDSVIVEKDFPDTLRVQVETPPVVLRLGYFLGEEDLKYEGFIGENGRFFLNGDESVFTVHEQDVREALISPLSIIFSASDISGILGGRKRLEEVTGREISSAELFYSAQEIHFVDEKGVKYWFLLKKDFELQVEKLERTLLEKNIYEYPLSYVDLRIGRKVIYKNK